MSVTTFSPVEPVTNRRSIMLPIPPPSINATDTHKKRVASLGHRLTVMIYQKTDKGDYRDNGGHHEDPIARP